MPRDTNDLRLTIRQVCALLKFAYAPTGTDWRECMDAATAESLARRSLVSWHGAGGEVLAIGHTVIHSLERAMEDGSRMEAPEPDDP